MAGYKIPNFDERAAASKAAKLEALAKLRSVNSAAKPAADTAGAAPSARDIAAAERRAAHRAAIEEQKAARAEARAKAQAEAAAAAEKAAAARRPNAPPVLPTAEELKAARDARYAARKQRQRA